MKLLIAILVSSLFILGVIADTKSCINKKYKDSLGQRYTTCYNKSADLPIPRMKKCYQEIMKVEQVVKVANNGQMTVDRERFGAWANANNNHVGRAMKACYDNTRADDRMYREAARASQCVFDGMKKVMTLPHIFCSTNT